MPAAPVKRYYPGDVVGNATIVRLVEDDAHYSRRLYEARLACCGALVIRHQKHLCGSARAGVTLCAACSAKDKRARQVQQPRGMNIQVGAVIGPVTVIAAGSSKLHKIVRWACCGNEVEVPHKRLHRLRDEIKDGHPHRCWSCYVNSRYGPIRRQKPPPPPPPPPPQITILPPGIISAAVAWPRPRVGA